MSEMYVVVAVTLVIALIALLVLGFLRAARELLSRSIYETPSCQDDAHLEQIQREPNHWQPGMLEYAGDPIRACLPNSRKS